MSYIEQSSLVKVTEEVGEVQNQSSQEPWAELLALENDPKLLEECVAYAIYSHPSKRRRGMNFTEEIRPGNMQSRGGQESSKQAKGKAATKKKEKKGQAKCQHPFKNINNQLESLEKELASVQSDVKKGMSNLENNINTYKKSKS